MTDIPELRSVPLLGIVQDVDPGKTHPSFARLADVYGEIFAYDIPGEHVVVVNSLELVNETCDEKRFKKKPSGGVKELRHGLGDGLFTAYNEEENWSLAHRTLLPKFGPLAITSMFDEMYDIATQMISKWARQGPDHEIDPIDDFTRLTLDSIALCAMGSRFNSFYRDKSHPFVTALVFFMLESSKRSFRPAFFTDYIYRASGRQYFESIGIMEDIARDAIHERQNHPNDKPDLLNAMLNGKDPKTGEGMSKDNILRNALTFLLAGHETTSGMLSFLFVELLKNPRTLKAAQEEVDNVIGKEKVTANHVSKLHYITACLRETLRLWPPAPGSRVSPSWEKDEDYPMYLSPNRYKINKGDTIQINMLKAHRDPKVYGEDAEQFKPERMLEENFKKLPPNSWKPFGNGMRACIGRAFAWQEGHIAVAMILQNFNLQAVDPSYSMKLRQTLTIKPTDFKFRASLRDGLDATSLEQRLWGGKREHEMNGTHEEKATDTPPEKRSPIRILFGSNAGTCESLAHSLANTASSHGFRPNVGSLDGATKDLPKDQPVIVMTPSYEGEPPDNARQFVEWLKGLQGSELEGVKYAVFGCGNHDWANTFHKIPTLVDDLLAQRGATRIAERGLSDVAENHVFDDFDGWQDNSLWPGIAEAFGHKRDLKAKCHGLDIEFHETNRSTNLRQDVAEAIVKEAKSLTAPGEPEKRYLNLQLPTGMTYTAGDYLAILPMNPSRVVKKIMADFGLPWDAVLSIKKGQHTILPQGKNITVFGILSSYVELNQPVTQKNLSALAACAPDEATRKALDDLTVEEIASKRISLVDVLSEHPSISIPFGDFLGMLSPLRVRQYSISSSPLNSPDTCTLTYGVLDTEAKSGSGKRYLGTASTYLSELRPGDRVYVSVRPSHQAFHPPLDVAKIPVIMICAGTGIAPFRGFVQQRREQIEAGRAIAPALLFCGCRHPEKDALYAEEFSACAEKGAIDIRYAFSRHPEMSEGCKYVQDRLWKDRDDAKKLWLKGARIYVCGSGKMAEEVDRRLVQIHVDYTEENGEKITSEEGEEWLKNMRNGRFASDVFD